MVRCIYIFLWRDNSLMLLMLDSEWAHLFLRLYFFFNNTFKNYYAAEKWV